MLIIYSKNQKEFLTDGTGPLVWGYGLYSLKKKHLVNKAIQTLHSIYIRFEIDFAISSYRPQKGLSVLKN